MMWNADYKIRPISLIFRVQKYTGIKRQSKNEAPITSSMPKVVGLLCAMDVFERLDGSTKMNKRKAKKPNVRWFSHPWVMAPCSVSLLTV